MVIKSNLIIYLVCIYILLNYALYALNESVYMFFQTWQLKMSWCASLVPECTVDKLQTDIIHYS